MTATFIGMKSYCSLLSWALALMMVLCKMSSADQLAPALFVFGDSLVDVGNNNHLPLSIFKVIFPPYGVDFPTHKPTGRFGNGKISADFIAEKIGLPSPPPYLSKAHYKSAVEDFLTGVSFASGGAGIYYNAFRLYGQAIGMDQQIECYRAVHELMVQQQGESGAEKILAKALFHIVVGSNDLLSYFGRLGSLTATGTPQQRVDSMIGNITSQIQQIHELGARKFAIIGIGPIGCCPSLRTIKAECNSKPNYWTSQYNQRLIKVLEELQSRLDGFQYTFLDTYNLLVDTLLPKSNDFGFTETKAACCGLGHLNADIPCNPLTPYCQNRSSHIFWDLVHPTERVQRITADAAFDGSKPYTFPMNIKQLLAA